MIKKILLLLFPALLTGALSFAQATFKKPLTHDVYDDWKALVKPLISDNGKYVSYETNQLKGVGLPSFAVILHGNL